MRHSLKSKRNEQAFEEKQHQLQELEELEEQAYLDLFYYDESGFGLTSALPYAWQEKGQTIQLLASRGTNINVAGLINKAGKFYYQQQEQSFVSKDVIAFLDSFCERIVKRTVVVLDNAPTHRSKAFMEKIKEWRQQDLFIFFLPAYSPELNKIEMLWKKCKYQWLDFQAYTGWKALKQSLKNVLDSIGEKYIVNFG